MNSFDDFAFGEGHPLPLFGEMPPSKCFSSECLSYISSEDPGSQATEDVTVDEIGRLTSGENSDYEAVSNQIGEDLCNGTQNIDFGSEFMPEKFATDASQDVFGIDMVPESQVPESQTINSHQFPMFEITSFDEQAECLRRCKSPRISESGGSPSSPGSYLSPDGSRPRSKSMYLSANRTNESQCPRLRKSMTEESPSESRLGFSSQDEEYLNDFMKVRRLDPKQIDLLDREFESSPRLNMARRIRLAAMLGLEPRQVEIWFQNKRTKTKTRNTVQSLQEELARHKLQYERLESANRTLQAQVHHLHRELAKSKREQRPGLPAPLGAPTQVPPDHPIIGVVQLNLHGEMCRVNAAFTRYLGYTFTDIAHKSALSIVAKDDHTSFENAVRVVTHGFATEVHTEKRFFSKSGAFVPHRLRILSETPRQGGITIHMVPSRAILSPSQQQNLLAHTNGNQTNQALPPRANSPIPNPFGKRSTLS